MNPKIDTITLGVRDRERARRFYEHGLGGAVGDREPLLIRLGGSASRLALRDWDAVARTADVDPHGSGFRAFTLSYIVDSADAVDALLQRATRNGGTISKPSKNAAWGYSAYVTDPDGYLWKIASSKRRPLLARRSSSPTNGEVITPQEVPITIGVADMKRSKEFYENGLGLPVKKSFGTKFVMFSGAGDSSDLGMYKREALAEDAAVLPEGSGFHGFTITHAVDSPENVDALLASAVEAGGRLVRPPREGSGPDYFGYFEDLDGNLWQVTSRN
jgi:catechol 2,3-dioxygenase-like lactoylglutathione lyase family enzyme